MDQWYHKGSRAVHVMLFASFELYDATDILYKENTLCQKRYNSVQDNNDSIFFLH